MPAPGGKFIDTPHIPKQINANRYKPYLQFVPRTTNISLMKRSAGMLLIEHASIILHHLG